MTGARTILALAAVSGFLAVAIAAFGAHGLSDARAKDLIDIAFKQHVAHTIMAFIAVGLAHTVAPVARYAAPLFLFGCLVFGGTLYAMALGGPLWLGAVTPVGGVAFLCGWGVLFAAAIRAQFEASDQ